MRSRISALLLVLAVSAAADPSFGPGVNSRKIAVAGAGPPTVRAVGTGDGGAAAVSPGLPTGTVPGDLLIMLVHTNDAAVTVSGWTECPSSPNTAGASTARITCFYKTSDGADATTTSDSGDHQYAIIIGITAGTWDTVTPFDTSGIDDDASGTAVATSAVTTGTNNCLILVANVGEDPDASGSAEYSAWANASLSSADERVDATFIAGDGGALGAATGLLVTAGSSGSTTATTATSTDKANITLAIKSF